jgi:Uma2 family endonuclease
MENLSPTSPFYGAGLDGTRLEYQWLSMSSLLVEVSDSSLSYDRDTKVPLYARAGIPEVWLVDVEGDVVLVYRDPTSEGYKMTYSARRGDSITPVSFPGREIAVVDILG